MLSPQTWHFIVLVRAHHLPEGSVPERQRAAKMRGRKAQNRARINTGYSKPEGDGVVRLSSLGSINKGAMFIPFGAPLSDTFSPL